MDQRRKVSGSLSRAHPSAVFGRGGEGEEGEEREARGWIAEPETIR